MSKVTRFWLAGIGAALFALTVAALFLPRSFGLNAFSDIIQCLLLGSGTVAFIPLARRAQGRLRLFWTLISLGISFWLTYQLLWTFYEIVLRRPVPDLFDGDVILFVHIVPLMAALALRPHIPRDEYAARLGRLDFGLLIIWWFYLYFLTVSPWLYVVPDATAYDRNLNALYLTEKLAFLTTLLISWYSSKGAWKRFYAHFFGAALCYSASSYVANWAIAHNLYYSGSAYDIPLATAMAWLTFIGLRTKLEEPSEQDARPVSSSYGIWVARASMIAVFSLPLFAVWALWTVAIPARIRLFRVELTLAAALVMGIMIFIRQHLLDRELVRLLSRSQDSFETLKRLQAQIVQSEKLASVGQLVGGAAHELNNPITAMLGYSDLLLSTTLSPEQQSVAMKIGQQVRRAKSLVASLISFARHTPASKASIDLNALARTALKLLQPQSQALRIELCTRLDSGLPHVMGDSNQLLQVCMHMCVSCLHTLSDMGGRIWLTTECPADTVILQASTELAPSIESSRVVDSRRDDLALTACEGILQEHRGRMSYQQRPDGSLRLQIELPAIPKAEDKSKSTASVLWQSRPYA